MKPKETPPSIAEDSGNASDIKDIEIVGHTENTGNASAAVKECTAKAGMAKEGRGRGTVLGMVFRWGTRCAAWGVILPIRGYQLWISPLIGPCCRFEPTCSQYFIDAVQKYGVFWGSLKGIWRILRCNPWCRGGYDPP